MAKLTIFYGDERKNVYKIRKDVITIGRTGDCDLTIPASSISRYHARVERRVSGYYIIDNNSTNGTLLNGREIREGRLSDGDEVYMGEAVLLFSYDELEYEETAREPDIGDVAQAAAAAPKPAMPPGVAPIATTTTRLKLGDLKKKMDSLQSGEKQDPPQR